MKNENLPEQDVDIVIVGLGPTGLTLAHQLGKRGLSVLVLEREPKFYGNARAVYTDGECMRIFQSIGMADTLSDRMLQKSTVQLVLPDGHVFWQLKTHDRQHGWPPTAPKPISAGSTSNMRATSAWKRSAS